MGCKFSNSISTYPGQKRQHNDPYAPEPSEFIPIDDTISVAKKHFVSYGGGNALVLVEKPAMQQPIVVATAVPMNQKKYVEATVPENTYPGETMKVTTPDGDIVECIVPDGLLPGTKFTVEFESGSPPVDDPDIPVVPAVAY